MKKSMAIKVCAVVLGFALAPAFIGAEHTAGSTIVGSTCLVRVYHTNFSFPPQGGRVVQVGNDLYFWRTYLPECANALPADQPVVVTSHAGTTTNVNTVTGTGLTGIYGNQLVGEPCSIRIYHTDFRFPPEGGKIVQYANGEMYFVRTYKAGCENAAGAGTVLAASSSVYNPLQETSAGFGGLGNVYSSPILTSVQNNRTTTSTTCY
jgi:hypothetical protein